MMQVLDLQALEAPAANRDGILAGRSGISLFACRR